LPEAEPPAEAALAAATQYVKEWMGLDVSLNGDAEDPLTGGLPRYTVAARGERNTGSASDTFKVLGAGSSRWVQRAELRQYVPPPHRFPRTPEGIVAAYETGSLQSLVLSGFALPGFCPTVPVDGGPSSLGFMTRDQFMAKMKEKAEKEESTDEV